MDTEIGQRGYSMSLVKLPPHFLQEIRSDLYVKPIENPNFQSKVLGYPVFRISKTKIYMPRYYAIEKYGQPLKNVLSETEINVEFKGTLREVQLKTIEETLKIYSQYGGGLISLDTGLGKTVVALKLISLMKQKTLILVHADFLLDQWIERIKTFLPDARIGIIKQNKCEWENVDICVGMIQSIIKRDYPPECFKSFGHLQIDECFPYKQFIATEDGSMEIGKIYNIWKDNKPLPKVLSFNEETKNTEYKNITYAWRKCNNDLLKIRYSNGDIECTYNHKILTPSGYVPAIELKVGDLMQSTIQTIKITSIEKVKNKTNYVYDIEVEDNHNFICSTPSGIGPIVHNCHHIGSKTFSSIFFKIQTKYMVGLSATPERKDGLSKVIYWFLGPQIVNIKRESGKPSIEFVYTDCSNYEEKLNSVGKVNNPTMVTDLTINQQRNKLIVDSVIELLKSDRKILILSDRRSHCEYLMSELTKLDISAGVYIGGMKTESRELSVNSKVIIGTYQASGEGFDVPDLDTLILATPKSDVVQPVGRILRQKNKNDPLIIDIADRFSIFNGQFIKRKRFYKKNDFAIK